MLDPRAIESSSAEEAHGLGKRNELYVIVEEGLGPEDRVALRDPTLVLEDLGGMEQDSEEATPQGATIQ